VCRFPYQFGGHRHAKSPTSETASVRKCLSIMPVRTHSRDTRDSYAAVERQGYYQDWVERGGRAKRAEAVAEVVEKAS
jgi:hypothetical protein